MSGPSRAHTHVGSEPHNVPGLLAIPDTSVPIEAVDSTSACDMDIWEDAIGVEELERMLNEDINSTGNSHSSVSESTATSAYLDLR